MKELDTKVEYLHLVDFITSPPNASLMTFLGSFYFRLGSVRVICALQGYNSVGRAHAGD